MKYFIKAVAVQGKAEGLIEDKQTTNGTTWSSEKLHDIYTDSMTPKCSGTMGTSETFLNKIADISNGYAPANFGSCQLSDGPGGDTWYNYIYIPHRNGIGSDNYRYGILILFNMISNTSNMWFNHMYNGSWRGWRAVTSG